jgi:hypothetical protein
MTVELRPGVCPGDKSGHLDEIVAKAVDLHLEGMDTGYIWMSITEEDGSVWHVHITSRGRITVKAEQVEGVSKDDQQRK